MWMDNGKKSNGLNWKLHVSCCLLPCISLHGYYSGPTYYVSGKATLL